MKERMNTSTMAFLVFMLMMVTNVSAQAPHSNHSAPKEPSLTSSPGRAAFEQFKRLEGKWRGRSTRGWDEEVSYKTIAEGSVVVANSFDAHPNETMLTLFHLDGERLMLTHYCVAKNQPRLVATDFTDEGKTITFTFLDGTNLPSRNRGHMDKLVFRFVNTNLAISRWTWYQDGKENWMEEITLDRIVK